MCLRMLFYNNQLMYIFRLALNVNGDNCEIGSKIATYPYHGLANQRFYINADGTIDPACNRVLQLSWTSAPGNIFLTHRNAKLYQFSIAPAVIYNSRVKVHAPVPAVVKH